MAIGTAAAIIGGSVIGGAASLAGSRSSARAAQSAADATTAESQRQFDLVRADTAGQRAIGDSAINRLGRLYGLNTSAPQPAAAPAYGFDPMLGYFPTSAPQAAAPTPQAGPDMSAFTESPDYQFNLAEGQKAIDRSLAARGKGLSGAAVREGVRYASGMASNEFGNFYNRLAGLAGLGQAGINTSANAGANSASTIANANANAGAARSSAYMTGAQGVNNAVQGGIANYMYGRGRGLI